MDKLKEQQIFPTNYDDIEDETTSSFLKVLIFALMQVWRELVLKLNPLISDFLEETITAPTATLEHRGASILNSISNAITATLPDGNRVGQIKTIVMSNATNSSTVSATHHETSDPEVATFDAVDETWVLSWTGTEWATLKATCTFL